jgi:outer membrane protein OmpA-like peptidoglycan-associated protein
MKIARILVESEEPDPYRQEDHLMKRTTQKMTLWVLAGWLMIGATSFAQDTSDNHLMKIAAGQKMKVAGLIVRRDADSFVLRDISGAQWIVKLSDATAVKEKKSNPFRGARSYAVTELVRGLSVEAEGIGSSDGALDAQSIRFTETQHLIATSVESRVTPVEGRLSDTEIRLTRSEENAKHLSGQVDEVRDISNTARGSAKAAQDTADTAVAGVNAANERITSVDRAANARIAAVDDYEIRNTATVLFKVGSFVLSAEAKSQLDRLVKEATAQKGYMIEVTGFASADGSEAVNRVLSQRRAAAVVEYFADNMIPLRRIIAPFGYGEKMPVADNATRNGREENRRVEVKVLTSRGILGGESLNSASNLQK